MVNPSNVAQTGALPSTLGVALQAEAEAVLATPPFQHSPTLSRLLRYLVDETLAGRGDRIKAYAIAVEGLGRPDDFDAETDSYPRVQAGRLRRLLAQHYATRPEAEQCLYIPSGAYRVKLARRAIAYPQFGIARPAATSDTAEISDPPVRDNAKASPGLFRLLAIIAIAAAGLAVVIAAVAWRTPSPAMPRSPLVAIAVSPDRTTGSSATGDAAAAILADGIRRGWVARVAVGPAASADYRLEAQSAGNQLFLRLTEPSSGNVVWSADRRIADGPDGLRTALAQPIAQLSAPFGVIGTAQRRRLKDDYSAGYACLLHYGLHFRTRDPGIGQAVRSCLREPSPEPQLQPVIDAVRAIVIYGVERSPAARPKALFEAKRLARNALSANGDSASVLGVNGILAFYGGDCGSGESFARQARAANPYDIEIIGSLGVLAYACNRELSRALLEHARALEPEGPINFTVPLLIMAIEKGDQTEIARFVDSMNTNAEIGPGVRALAYAVVASARNDRAKARAQWAVMVRATPGQFASDDEMLRRYILSDPLRQIAVDQLAKGGVMVSKTAVTPLN